MKKILPIIVCLIAISACTQSPKRSRTTNSDQTSNESKSNSSSDEGVTSKTSTPTSQGSKTSSNSTSSEAVTSHSSTGGTSVTTVTSGSSQSSNSSATSSVTPSGNLPNSYELFPAPTNTPIEIETSETTDHWWNNDLSYDFPSDDWSYLNGTSYHTLPKFYDQEPGGLKMDYKKKGFQTPMFHHNGPKLEISIGISQYNVATSGTVDKSTVTGYVFFYNQNGQYLSSLTHEVPNETLVPGYTRIHFYVTGSLTPSVAYFEFRLNHITYKGNTCYNFGIGSVNVHSWAWE